jgi:SAM-dependent methyltransferase
MLYTWHGRLFPEYLKHGNAVRFIAPTASQFCRGRGVDVGAGAWPLEGAEPIDLRAGGDAMRLGRTGLDYVFSSHCLEHLPDPIGALEHWRDCLRPGGVLFLYLPHPAMGYWLPQHCRKHLHSWQPQEMLEIVTDLGFADGIRSERDLAWSFAVVAFKRARGGG